MDRICTRCGEAKPNSEFTKRTANQKNGKGLCRSCKGKMDRNYRQKNKEKVAKYFHDKWRSDHSRREKNKTIKELRRTGMDATAFVKDKSCQTCGLTNQEHLEKYGERLHIHHRDNTGRKNIRTGVDPVHENMVVLCRSCHVSEDLRMRHAANKENQRGRA